MKVILHVEDTESDAVLLQTAVRRLRPEPRVVVAGDGMEAMEYLSGAGQFSNRHKHPFPDLVLLDKSLPRASGLEVLKWIRARAQFARLPVVMFTSDAEGGVVETAYRLGASGYVVKRGALSELVEVIRAIRDCWLQKDGRRPDCASFLTLALPCPSAFKGHMAC